MWSVTEEAGTSLDPFWRSLAMVVRPGLLLMLLLALWLFFEDSTDVHFMDSAP